MCADRHELLKERMLLLSQSGSFKVASHEDRQGLADRMSDGNAAENFPFLLKREREKEEWRICACAN